MLATLRSCILIYAFTAISMSLVHAQSQPNIILIMSDDQGWFDAGFNGNKILKTPHLDKLAKQGIIFNRFYSASAVCSPTRASVITGRNPYRMGIPGANSGSMKGEEITLAELLKEKGYSTGHFGKWHLGIQTRKELDANRGGKEANFSHYSIPSMHGYDEYFCTESKVPTYDPMVFPAQFKEGESKRYGWAAVQEGDSIISYNTAYWIGDEQKAEENLSGDDSKLIMDRVIPFINKSLSNNKPFFATVWTHAPHLPVVSNDYYRAKYAHLSYREQLYYGCISALDDQIGRLWSELESLGIAGSTLIWFCSDNGPEDRTPGSAAHFRGRKRSLHEGGLRTPAFVVWPDKLKGNRRTDFPAFTSDYLPTILSVLDMDYPHKRPMDGINLMPYIENPAMEREKPMGFQYKKQISWVSHRYKLISKDQGQSYELYDLIEDEKEEHDLLKEKAQIAARMQKELNEWLLSLENSSKGKDYN